MKINQICSLFMPVVRYSDEGYDRFALTKQYIQKCSAKYPDPYPKPRPELFDLIRKSGCSVKKLHKFRKRRKGWDNIRAYSIPRLYLDAIGAKREIIEFCLEEDQKAFDIALEKPFFPTECFYAYKYYLLEVRRFAHGTTQEEATEMMVKWHREENRSRGEIMQPGIRSIYTRRKENGEVEPYVVTYRPDLIWNEREVEPSWDGTIWEVKR